MNYIIIHVGKCSGTVLNISLKYHKISFKVIHHANERNPVPIIPNNLTNGKGDYQFIFCIRHPIDRFISAFNFKYTRLIIRGKRDHFKGEIEGFKYFETIQKLAENLYNNDGSENLKAINFCSNCDHIKYGLHHYLNNFNETYNIRVIRHEYLKEDYKNIFNKDIHLPEKNAQPNFISDINSSFQKYTKIEITKKMYNNLKRFLKKDMDIIERLEKYNLITKEYKEFCLNKLPNNIILTD
ncbi:MAG: hypothetical protein CMF80_08155 [Candidatus Marinimicrobia bacterium]|nr:hypothetical protein [Candidatus Neomarinimicrobiota bacterium]